MITLLVVLVLLFVIFRLMPGDPTRFFIRPGQSQQDVDDLKVSFGFAKRMSAPGHGFQAAFDTRPEGTYELSIAANDTRGRSADFYFYHVKQLERQGPTVSVSASAPNGDPPWSIGPGEDVSIRARLLSPPSGLRFNATLAITAARVDPGNVPPMTEGNADGTEASAQWAPPAVGSYSLTVTFQSETTSARFVGYAGVAANVASASPFALVETHLSTTWVSDRFDRASLTINVTSQGASIARVSATIRPPAGAIETLAMSHPQIVVETNVLEEFWVYLTSMLQGDFGKSLYYRTPVWNIISEKAGPSILLFGSAVLISYALGILIGAIMAWRRGSKMELSTIVVSLFFSSMPVFWFGLILLWAFAFSLHWFPSGRFADFAEQQAGGLTYVVNVMKHMALPLLNLVILGLASHVLLMRNSMLEVLGEDYILTAKAKGLSERRVMYRHAARNAMLPVVTAFALSISGVVSGGVLTETIFSWPGMGAFLVQSTIAQDFPSVQGAFFLLALLTILANLIADVLYAYLDPRVRL